MKPNGFSPPIIACASSHTAALLGVNATAINTRTTDSGTTATTYTHNLARPVDTGVPAPVTCAGNPPTRPQHALCHTAVHVNECDATAAWLHNAGTGTCLRVGT